ncbi:CO or xanthine dehydrogenase, FAD-binding subunit [Anaerovirgula multivorans]|uniref:CO or xanthine dehydrogenase, FAD-binding subunit n=1 Tax=Anaerovirgula multivorans TaxID=312168 RepID=A0A239EA80_9FIRM|nr:FAD binding domain-containing protein [Anaerovirgula multivorans]SNS41389.1 CO or xanthine dehydrogenase, FAD-binding subunit [Anaerovirgula multivorans]
MFTIQHYVQPETLEEAYQFLTAKRNNVILGGCAFLKMSKKKIGTAIDLSKLQLDFIHDKGDVIEIGAMATFRSLEVNPYLNQYFNGIIPKSIKSILGVQFRNVVTIGGTVYSRYGFSDLITALLALDVDIELYHGGIMPLETFLKNGSSKDILVKVILHKNNRIASYQMMRNSVADYPILNVAVSKKGDDWKIVIGARPRRAEIAVKASEYLTNNEVNETMIKQATNIAMEELDFGTNMRGQKTYRQAIAVPLVKRGIMEVLK